MEGKMIIYKEKYLEYFNNDTQIRVAEITMPHRPDAIRDAEDVLHRWNEHDTLQAKADCFDELLLTIQAALVSLAIINMPVQEDNLANVATNDDLLKIMADSFRQAIAKAEKLK